jgi:MerR family transcriptional regulator/heat shock protein HspR
MERENHAVYVISVAAELSGMHPQTLRIYERRGLLQPARTAGGNRRYSDADIHRLLRIAQLAAAGMNLEGIRQVMQLEVQVSQLGAELANLRNEMNKVSAAAQRGRSELVPLRQAVTLFNDRRKFFSDRK